MFAFGSKHAWEEAWTRALVACLSNNGIVLAASPMALNMVIRVLKLKRDFPSYEVCTGLGKEPMFPMACVIENSVLRMVNLNSLFPIERPILIIDDSMKWEVTWEWLAFLPTFHISSPYY